MAREVDVRNEEAGASRVDDERRSELNAAAEDVSARLPGEHEVRVVSFDDSTGNAAVVVSSNAAPVEGNYVARALAHVNEVGPALGLAAEQPAEFVADPEYQTTSMGSVAVHLRQQYKGIPIYDGAETVRFESDGRLKEIAGRSFTVGDEVAVSPALTAEVALRAAVAYLAAGDDGGDGDGGDGPRDPFGEPLSEPVPDLSQFDPVARTVAADKPDRSSVFDTPPFGHAITVSLMWFPLGAGLRLGWHMRLAMPDGPQYRVIVDAADGRVLLCKRLSRAITGRATVVLRAGDPARPVTLPLPLATYGAPVPEGLPAGFPDHWLLNRTTDGAAVRAVNATTMATSQGAEQAGEVVFSPSQPPSTDDLVVNLFALCSVMHDVLYLLGFREDDGNFQVDNLGRGGRQSDPVLAKVHPGSVWGTANMSTPPDGQRPEMNMGLVTSTRRHTALDPDVVYHEYTHGLTNRLVGGPMNDTALDAEQSSGMGEGWSDFFACVILGKTVVGDWVVQDPTGIRRHPYDDAFPDTYGDLGTSAYQEVHDVGELWCATLMDLARRIGPWVAAQVVTDALKLTSANPSFLAARDAILLASRDLAASRGDDEAHRAAFVASVWETFARFGMGPGARTNGATLTGIVADFSTPPRAETTTVRATATPGLAIPDDDPTGVRSSLSIASGGPVEAVTVGVDITHTYRGDLVVTLVAPDGRSAVLHQRAGGSANDLQETWSSAAGHAALTTLAGAPAVGTWELRVADLARVDTGTLNSWTLELAVGEARSDQTVEVTPGLAIPDNDPTGVTSTAEVTTGGTVVALELSVDITHTYIGDLEVALLGPTGKRVVVHRRAGGSADNLITSYGSGDKEPLAPFVGLDAGGMWTLTVVDKAGRDVGKLNRWRLVCHV